MTVVASNYARQANDLYQTEPWNSAIGGGRFNPCQPLGVRTAGVLTRRFYFPGTIHSHLSPQRSTPTMRTTKKLGKPPVSGLNGAGLHQPVNQPVNHPVNLCRNCWRECLPGQFRCDLCREAARWGVSHLFRRPAPKPMKRCPICGTEFTAKVTGQEACDRKCGSRLGKIRSDAVRSAKAVARRQRQCKQCGKPFVAIRPNGGAYKGERQGVFCSRTCQTESQRVYPDERARRAAEYRRRRDRQPVK